MSSSTLEVVAVPDVQTAPKRRAPRAKKVAATKATTKTKKAPAAAKAAKTTAAKPKVAKTTEAKKSAKKATKATAKKSPTKRATKTMKSKVTKEMVKPATKGELQTIKRHPLGHLLLEQKLREAGFRGGVSSDKKLLTKYSIDESIFSIRPQVILQPKNAADIKIATKVVADETKRFSSLSLTPRAAGTGLSGGSLTDSIVIDVCTHMHKIEDVVEKKNLITITCEPGAMWRDVEKKLKAHKAYLPSYTSSKDICSIGGSIGNNAAGPDSLRYGHCADWIESLNVVLADGEEYTIKPLTYKEFKTLTKKKHEYARIAREIFALIEKNEKLIKSSKPETQKNTAGYALWNVLSGSVNEFKKGKATFDLNRVIAGSQGTVGVITSVTMRALPIATGTTLIAVPVFDLDDASKVVSKALVYDPINIELFDSLTFELALKNPDFFKQRLSGLTYYRAMLAMYSNYHIRYRGKTPEFIFLITLDAETTEKTPISQIATTISTQRSRARVVKNPYEAEMLWQIRRASYTLSKFQDVTKRPAAFLEDMTVPPESLSKFFTEIKKLFKEFNVSAAVHGHGGNGHFHFYPLLDFTKQTTPLLIEKMAERFYSTAVKYHGSICGEHNDGIIRTPHLNKLFNKKMLDLFIEAEHIFDPDDIFNPGKKVNPRFDIKESMRTIN